MAEQLNQSLEDIEFTHRWYRRFLRELLAEGYDFRTFTEPLRDGDIALRHDVDLSVAAALTMAELEAELGVQSTYCVLLTSSLYNPLQSTNREAIGQIDALGHDIALHFSTHEYWPEDDPPSQEAIETRVRDERDVLETIVSTAETVSFHRPPQWVLDREFEGFESTYAPRFFSDIGYVADSNQRWRDEPPRIDELPETVQLLTHPGLWGDEDGGFETQIEAAITDASDRTGRNARREFISGESD